MSGASEGRSKPKPFKWLITGHGVVECYDFQFWKKSDPPAIDADPVTLEFPQQKTP